MKYKQCPTCGHTIKVKSMGFKKAMGRMNKLMIKWHREEMNE